MEQRNLIRIGILALPTVGFLYVLTLLIRGPVILNPAADATSFARAITSFNYAFWEFGSMAAAILDLLGVLALCTFLAAIPSGRWAIIGLVLVYVHDALYLTFLGAAAYAWPALGNLILQGQQAVIATVGLTPLFLLLAGLGGILGTIGWIIIGVATWRSGTLPKWTAILLALSLPLLVFGPVISFVAEFLGGVVFALAGGGIAYRVWRG